MSRSLKSVAIEHFKRTPPGKTLRLKKDETRPSRSSGVDPYNNRRWRGARRQWLDRNPLCRACLDRGQMVTANVVDHIVPHRGDTTLFWNTNNWQSLCAPCHNAKTARGE